MKKKLKYNESRNHVKDEMPLWKYLFDFEKGSRVYVEYNGFTKQIRFFI